MKYIGVLFFYILWPFVWFYAPLVRRSRAIFIVDDKVLLVKNWFGPGVWQLPGGGIQRKESPTDAVRREVYEELGLHVGDGNLLNEEPMIVKSRGLLLREYYTVYKMETPPILRIGKELIATEYVSIDKAPLPQKVKSLLDAK